jgi:Uma2 family endonuclease
MATAVQELTPTWTAADLGERFGSMPLWRIRFDPFPGTATEQDVLDVLHKEGRLCELVDGVLVEKPMGFRESALAATLITFLKMFVTPRRLGTVTAPDGTLRLTAGLVRIPDVAFISWDRIPGRRLPQQPIPNLVPDLAVEVLSRSNTADEMERKRREYFGHGARLVWLIDPEARTVTVYTDPATSAVLHEAQTLDGGSVLPGFELPLRDLFAELDEQTPPPEPKSGS